MLMKLIDYARYCQMAYDRPTHSSPDGRDSCYVEITSERQVYAFRGTLADDSLIAIRDWLNDFHANLIRAKGFPGKVHEGFHDSFFQLTGNIPRPTDGLPLYVVGHSKGGALCSLFGWWWKDRKPICVSFASPMTGDDDYREAHDAEVMLIRVVNPHDVVPKLPPVGYSPEGYKVELEAPKGSISQCHGLQTGYIPFFPEVAL